MDTPADHPAHPAQTLIVWTIQGTWIFYVTGALYITGPALGWTLALMVAWRFYVFPTLPRGQRPGPLPLAIVLWLIGMAGMEVALLAGHIGYGLGIGATIKSSIGWAKGWALLALYPLAGAALPIRPEAVYRAVCRLGLQTLILLPLLLAAPMVGLPSLLYVSPLSVVGGSGPEFFAVMLYIVDPENGASRWQFYAPWAPAAGMVAVIHMICALQERRLGWMAVGLLANLLIAYLSGSRMAILATAILWPVALAASHMRRPALWFAAAPAVLLGGLFATTIREALERAVDDFKGARADSSRVRAALGRIAVERWRNEAPWFGHGVLERGPHMVEFMPIGSHHSWYGLLFVKGIVGLACLAIPLAFSVVTLFGRAMHSRTARTGFAMALVLTFYTFGENLEILGYLIWPGLLLIGMGTVSRPDAPPAAPAPPPIPPPIPPLAPL
ncbi:O-antigen ligase domain-containing protein [Novosphingobium sp. 1949]|uniref:O-antigen ligase domain-containing protein n=1 Tax=Novosphingobium organovorum TaxID=2930092 RepID=A0ABT0BHT4_9SPHN|nr:O-antigen ligase domain-containing protein [Novosphingobium organovorum]MCJ2184599.1 O-antigen ligase domain-containing protein [Novosphingobium organovorum]